MNPYYHYRMAYESYKKNPSSGVKTEFRRVRNDLFKILKKKNFYPPLAQEALTDWNLNDIYTLSKKIYQNVGGWTGFKEEIWNLYPESFMYFVIDPFTMWIWATHLEQYNRDEFISIVPRTRENIYQYMSNWDITEEKMKDILKFYFKYITNNKQLFKLSDGIYRRFKDKFSWVENEYSFVDLIKGRVYRLIREGNVEKIEPKSSLECVICMERPNEFRFHPKGFKHHTICGECLESLPKLECPYCKIELVGDLLKK